MGRGRPQRIWVKMHCEGCLHGSINYQLTLEEQAVFFKLIMLSAVCTGEPGTISDNDGRAMPHWYIANELHAPLEVFESTLKKCIKEGRLSENTVGILVTNFKVYQSEYERQKPYRKNKQKGEPTQAELDASDYHISLALKFKEFRKTVGRDPNLGEEKAILEEAEREYNNPKP